MLKIKLVGHQMLRSDRRHVLHQVHLTKLVALSKLFAEIDSAIINLQIYLPKLLNLLKLPLLNDYDYQIASTDRSKHNITIISLSYKAGFTLTVMVESSGWWHSMKQSYTELPNISHITGVTSDFKICIK